MKRKNGKKSLFKKPGKYYALTGLFILTIAFVHFSMQLSFIQKENLRTIETANEIEIKPVSPVKQVVEIAPEHQVIEIPPEQIEVEKVTVIKIPEIVVKPEPRIQKKTAPPVRKTYKNREVPETRAERLRRAERILTGV